VLKKNACPASLGPGENFGRLLDPVGLIATDGESTALPSVVTSPSFAMICASILLRTARPKSSGRLSGVGAFAQAASKPRARTKRR